MKNRHAPKETRTIPLIVLSREFIMVLYDPNAKSNILRLHSGNGIILPRSFTSSAFEHVPVIKDEVYASGDPNANGHIEEVKNSPFLKNCKENNS